MADDITAVVERVEGLARDAMQFVGDDSGGMLTPAHEWITRLANELSCQVSAWREERARGERLEKALKPFARFAEAGWQGTAWESAQPSEPVLFNHRTGVAVTAGDFRQAAQIEALKALVQRTDENAARQVDSLTAQIEEMKREVERSEKLAQEITKHGRTEIERLKREVERLSKRPSVEGVTLAICEETSWPLGGRRASRLARMILSLFPAVEERP